MKFLIIHSRYSHPGGEERVAELQAESLRAAGHTVVRYERSYDETRSWRFGRFTSLCSALYNRRSVREIRALLAHEQPDVALVHNLFPVVSPAVLPVLHQAGVVVVQMVHNYRLGCPTGLAFRNGSPCAQCPQQRSTLPCVRHRCQGSLLGSMAFALRSAYARSIYSKNIDLYCAVSDYVRHTLVDWGVVKAPQTVVLTNPVVVPSIEPTQRQGVLFVGRFTPEKGAALVLELAWRLPHVAFTVTADQQEAPPNVHFVGTVDRATLDALYARTQLVVCPSGVAETFGLAAAEGMAAGAVAVVSDRGALPELVEGGAGVCVAADDTEAWVAAIEQLLADPVLWARYAHSGRQRIADRYASKGYAERLSRCLPTHGGAC